MKIKVTYIEQVDYFLPFLINGEAYRNLDDSIKLFWRAF